MLKCWKSYECILILLHTRDTVQYVAQQTEYRKTDKSKHRESYPTPILELYKFNIQIPNPKSQIPNHSSPLTTIENTSSSSSSSESMTESDVVFPPVDAGAGPGALSVVRQTKMEENERCKRETYRARAFCRFGAGVASSSPSSSPSLSEMFCTGTAFFTDLHPDQSVPPVPAKI